MVCGTPLMGPVFGALVSAAMPAAAAATPETEPICCRTPRSSASIWPAFAGRCCGSFCRQRSTKSASGRGTCGAIWLMDACACVQACTTIALGVSPSKGGRPVSAS
ncbi:MAG: hypothetical protein M5U28_36525 [Sandaracinaceae bacterium]|nr:hypothetical protein [Sandaracinaceae bacterium]